MQRVCRLPACGAGAAWRHVLPAGPRHHQQPSSSNVRTPLHAHQQQHHHHHTQQRQGIAAAECAARTPGATAAPPDAGPSARVYLAPSEAHLQHLAALLARELLPGDCYCLHGSVGAGKSVFSRAFIRAAAGEPQLQVPSPTYLLDIMYDEHEGPPIHHYDLYRLQPQQRDMARLDLPASLAASVCLVEWAERLPPDLLPQQRLEVAIAIEPAAAAPGGNGGSSDGGDGGAAAAPLGTGGGVGSGPAPTAQDARPQQPPQQPQQAAAAAATAVAVRLPLPPRRDRPDAGDEDGRDAAAAAAAAKACEGEDAEEEDGAQEDEADPWADTRCRRVQLLAVGPRWVRRLQALDAALAAGGGG